MKDLKINLLSTLVIALVLISVKFSNLHIPKVAGLKTQNKIISGIILPHHELAQFLIVDVISRLKEQGSPQYVVVFSPNHFHSNMKVMVTTDEVNFSIEGLVIDKDLITNDHGVMTPSKYLTNIFPNTKIIPFVFTRNISPEKVKELAGKLVEVMPKDTLYVTSLDLSHGEMLQEALAKDDLTLNIINNFDYLNLYQLQDDHLDSPQAVSALLYIMQKKGTANWEKIYETHGSLLTGNPTLRGTSYVTGVFR